MLTAARYCHQCGAPLSSRPGYAPDLLRTVLEALPNGVFAFDHNERLRYWGKGMEAHSGIPRRDALGRAAFELLPQLQVHAARILRAFDAPAPVRLEPLAATGDGSRTESFWFGPIVLEDGSAALLGVMEDLTHKIQVDTQLIRSERLAAIGELAAGVAHNFNNILAAIGGDAQLLKMMAEEDQLPEPVVEAARQIHLETMRGGRIAHDLLSFARGAEPHLQRLNLHTVLEDAIRLIKNHPSARRVNIESSLREDLPPVEADANQLHQVFFNLLLNALQAMPRGGVLTVSGGPRADTRDPDRGVIDVKVHDTGVGIPKERLQRIFDPFYSRRADGGMGSGLGLSVSLAMVNSLGGDIQISSAEGIGTTVTVTLPIVERRTVARSGARIQAARRLLVVDDDLEVRRTLTTLFSRQGYEVTTAVDGAEALARMDDSGERPFDAMVTELTLAEVDGVALIRHLRSLRPTMPILVLTGESDPRRRVEAMEAGGDFGFSKPPDFGELMGILEQLLDARAAGSARAVTPVEAKVS